jgi:gliding motility-associated-like protein
LNIKKAYLYPLFIFCFVLLNKKSFSQYNQGNCPNNIDFEFGNFNNWTTYTGSASSLSSMMQSATPVGGRHEILTRANNLTTLDPYGNFPVISPNGSGYSVKLGNEQSGNQAEKIRYEFVIPSSATSYSVIVYYAVIFQNPNNHTDAQQPKFIVNAFDKLTGNPVGCSFIEFIANGTLPGFQNSALNSLVKYKDWTPLTLDLSGYAGQTVVLEFTSADCTLGGHFGYAYLDVSSNCISPVVGYAYCNNADQVTLTAPFGYQTYKWWNDTYSLQYGSQNNLTLAPTPLPGTVINLDITPFPGFGCRDTISVTLTAEAPPPAPSVPAAIVNYCQGDVAQPLTANILTGYLPNWYTSATSTTPLLSAPTPSTVTTGNTSYFVSQVSFGGCEGPRTEVVVSIGEVPSANFSINDTIQCFVNHNFIFTNTTTPQVNGYQYQWTFGNNLATASTNNASFQFPTVGNYNVELKAYKGSCVNSKIIVVQVLASPLADFTATSACQGQAINFTNTSTASPTATYLWNFGNGQTSTLNNPSNIFSTSGNQLVALTVSEGNCQNTISKAVTVNPVPFANFTFTSKCQNDSIQFNDASLINNGVITSWLWDFGNGQTSSLQNPKMAYVNNGNYNVKLTVSTNNCSKDTTIPITIHEKPIARLLQLDTACFGQSVKVKDDSYFVNGVGAATVTNWWWQDPNGITGNSANFNVQNTVINPVLLKLVVTSNFGCVSDTGNFALNLKPIPTAKIQLLTPLCENRLIQIEDITANASTRNWKINNQNVGTSKVLNVNNLPNGLVNLRLQATDEFGCVSLPKDTVLTIQKRPSFNYQYLDSCVEKAVPFVAVDNDINKITNWFWEYDGNKITGSNLQSFLFSKFGQTNVSLSASDAFGCISDTVAKVIKLNYNPVFAGNDTIAAALEPVQLNAKSNIASTYLWSPAAGLSNPNIANPIATNSIIRNYTVTATSIYGCKTKDNVTVHIYDGPEVYIPTIFTPNNDGVNDVLNMVPVGMKKLVFLKIYNRFGQLVFETSDFKKSWDGIFKEKFAANGAYIFQLNAIKANGELYKKKGTIVLQR